MEAAGGVYPEFYEANTAAGRLALMGLGNPSARAAVAATVVGGAAYALSQPTFMFRKNGTAKPWSLNSAESDAILYPFFLVPLTAATAVYLFT